MGQPRRRYNPGRLPRVLCILENGVDVIAFVGFGAAISKRDVRTHREHAKVGLDAAEEGCCRAGGVGHLVVDAICLRKVGISILVNNSGSRRFAPSKVQRMEISRRTKLSLRRPCTSASPFGSGSTFHLPGKLSDFSPASGLSVAEASRSRSADPKLAKIPENFHRRSQLAERRLRSHRNLRSSVA